MPAFLPKAEFLQSLQLAPRLVVDVVLSDGIGRIYLIKRDAEPFKGLWHLPGSFLLKGESLRDCASRVAVTEIGISEIGKFEFAGLFENIKGDPRGHLLHYLIKATNPDAIETEGKRWFSEVPQDMIGYQKDYVASVGF